MVDYKKVEQKFKQFIKQYEENKKEIAILVSHSYHVADLAQKLAKRMELDSSKTNLVKTLGLIHTMTWFLEEKGCETKNLPRKTDSLLLEEMTNCGIEKEYIPIIQLVLKEDPKITMDEDRKEEIEFYRKFLQDIDTIDNYRKDAIFDDWVFVSPSKDAVKACKEHHLVDPKNCQTKTDELIAKLAFLFNMHFKESYSLLNDTDNLELFLSVIEIKRGYEEEFESIKKEVINFLKEKTKEME